MDICVIGVGHVGLVTAACFAKLGHQVIAVDNDAARIDALKQGTMPFYEPDMEALVQEQYKAGALIFTTSIEEGVSNSRVVFICVGTPQQQDGSADLSIVEHVVNDVATCMESHHVVVEKSTVPVETGYWIERTLRMRAAEGIEFDVASNPEFLCEGTAVRDFMHPDRIVIGVSSDRAKDILLELYEPLNVPIVVTDVRSSELIKHASNAFLSTKISFINAVAQVCERVGADVESVAEGMGMDPRIGRAFLNAGPGFGGFCFPKDLDAFIHIAAQSGYDFQLLKAVRQVNEEQQRHLVKRIESALWVLKDKKIALLGLAFKAGTDDMRYSPALSVIDGLTEAGAVIRAYDPQAMDEAQPLLRDKPVTMCADAYEAIAGADCVAIVTEWPEFTELDFGKVKSLLATPLVVDGRNMLDPAMVRSHGLQYVGIGRENPPA